MHSPLLASLRPSMALAFFILVFVGSVQAAPAPKIISHHITTDGVLYATIEDGDGPSDILVEEGVSPRSQALIVDGGYALIYQTRGSASGGYENKCDAVKRYNVKGVKKMLLDKPLKVMRLREVRAKSTRNVYVISMIDGGAGIPTLYLADSTKGELWSQDAARFSAIRSGNLIVSLYPKGEAGVESAPIGSLNLDLDKLLDKAYGFKN